MVKSKKERALDGTTILITGVTGFFGKTIVEKLLRTAPQIDKIYVPIRPRAGVVPSVRLLAEIIDSPIFDRLRREQPHDFVQLVTDKLHAVGDNTTCQSLALTPEDAARLKTTVNVMIHSVATVDFCPAHNWATYFDGTTLTHVDTTLVKATHTVHSAMDCDVMATRDLNGQKVSFHAHPHFTRIVQLWGGNGRYNTTRSFYRQQVAVTRTQIGKDTRDAAVNKAVQTAGSLWPGLQLIQWSELHNIPGITVYTAPTLLRLKANRLSMWNYEKADLSCSNPECSQVVQSSVQHLFWECPKAKLVWNYFYALWAKIGITPGHDPATWIFSLDLPDTPRHAWTTIKRHIIGHKLSNEHLQDHLYPVAHMLCRYMSSSLIHAIWCAHLRRMDSDPIKSTAEMAIMMTRLEAGMQNLTRLAEAQAGDSDGHTVAAVLKGYVDCFLSQTDAIPLTPSDTRGVYLLFFDGGSRGNPGPGGTGSIITSRRLVDCIDIRGWYHHYRAFNKMADSAANLAMNTRTSTQVHFPTQRAAFNNLTQDLDNDVMHWLMRSSEDPSNRRSRYVQEKLYPIGFDVDAKLHEIMHASPIELEELTENVQRLGYPNTYTFTKSMAEHLVTAHAAKAGIPLVLFQPTIFGAAWKEPVPGWVDQIAGIGATMLAMSMGVVTVIPGKSHNVTDVVPVDVAVNSLLVATGFKMTEQQHAKEKKLLPLIAYCGTSNPR
ncbi:Fatty acyl-coa reductase, partial [Globisporangium splendens]